MVAVSLSASRRDVLGGLGAGVASIAVGVGSAGPAVAGYMNADSLPEVLQPSASAIDRDVLKSSRVQEALKEIKFFDGVVKEVMSPGQSWHEVFSQLAQRSVES